MIVAHSMGGLVSRAALASGGGNVERVVLLGTPNLGSFAPVQALRGTYAVVRKIARLALQQSAEMLAADVFKTFPSLYHLLPLPEVSPKLDFFDPASWPATGPQPDAALLAGARRLGGSLASGDERFAVIVGEGQETVTRATRRGEQFQYTITRRGDGTVPTACALLPGASTHYTSVAHSELARDEVVARAIADLLKTGRTKRLDSKPARISAAEARISDAELRRTHAEKVDWAGLEPDARRVFLQTLNEPPQLRLRLPVRKKKKKASRARPTRAK
jgi:pimeloyl-ACP methyl ester carboxylesterase